MIRENDMKRITALLLAALFAAFSAATAAAEGGDDGLVAVFEEDFEEYENDVNVSSTKMPEIFICDYNSIGDGIICVKEDKNGNLSLFSHVFTQIFISTPIIGKYEFSMKVYEAQGNIQSGLLVRAPKTDAAYYEADGNPDTSTALSGLFINPHNSSFGVNVKTYDESSPQTNCVKNNITTFDLPEGTSYPYELKVKDDCETVSLFCNGTLICSVKLADPGKKYPGHQASASECFGSAVLYDAQGKELGSYKDPLMQSGESIIAWSTRAANMTVDDVTLRATAAYKTLVAIQKIPSKITEKNAEDAYGLITGARQLYDSLSDEDKALVGNIGKLTKAEDSVSKLMPETTAAGTDPETAVPATDAQTDAGTAADTAGGDTDAPGTEQEEIVYKTVDDSLAVYIIIAVILAMIGAAAGIVAVKVRK